MSPSPPAHHLSLPQRERSAEHPGPDALIDRVAASQHGVVTRAQVIEAGLSPRAVDRRVASGRLHVVHRGVYRVGPLVTRYTSAMAALLTCAPDGVLSHRTAGALWRILDDATPPAAVHITLPNRIRRRVPGITAHRSRRLNECDITQLETLRITTPARTLLDLALILPSSELERAIARAERSSLIRTAELLACARSVPPHPAAARIRELLEDIGEPALTRSEAEARLLSLIRRARLPRPLVNTSLRGFEVDFFWGAERLVVEVDGFAFHGSQQSFIQDRRRDADLTNAGYRVIRLSWDDVHDRPEATIVILAQALHRGSAA
jgi:very-short-patch-repair endonuclease